MLQDPPPGGPEIQSRDLLRLASLAAPVVTWARRRSPRPLALDHLFFGDAVRPRPDDSQVFDRFLTALMWVCLAVLAFLALTGAVLGLYLLGVGWGTA